MSKIINISGKFSTEKPVIELEGKQYPVNDSIAAVMAFEEAQAGGIHGVLDAMKGALGESAYDEIGVENLSFNNIKVLATAVLAAQADISFEDAAARFQLQQ